MVALSVVAELFAHLRFCLWAALLAWIWASRHWKGYSASWLRMRSFRGADTSPLSIRLEKARSRLFSFFLGGLRFGRRACRTLPSSSRLFMSPSSQEWSLFSRQVVWFLGFELRGGFCRSSTDITVTAFSATDSRAEPSAELGCEPFPSVAVRNRK